jgi:[glutamine synthetase] adenylyltransferase / [glutamine synthetase]-adenylyl-L-tyrosine phosphorylase
MTVDADLRSAEYAAALIGEAECAGLAVPPVAELAQALAASDFLGDALRTDHGLLARLAAPAFIDPAAEIDALLAARPAESEFAAALRRIRRRVMADIAWRDISGRLDLDGTLAAVSAFADLAIRSAVAFAEIGIAERYGHVRGADGAPQPLVVIGMGKLGGRELNFSSDIDLVFLYPDSGDSDGRVSLDAADYYRRLGQAVIRLLDAATVDGYVFRVDMRLRPFGDSGPLVVSFAALEDYLQSHGRDWERYAWVKARAITGEEAYAALFKDTVRPFVYRRYLDFGVFESLREMKALISREIVRRDLVDDVKLGDGGIREVEFITQAFQLLRGGSDPRLQCSSLLTVLPRLLHQKLLTETAVAELTGAYRFLRRVENRLQMLADQQTHRLPGDPLLRRRLAEGLGFADYAALAAALGTERQRVSTHFHAFVQSADGGASRALDLSILVSPNATVDAVAAALVEQGVRDADAQAALLLELVQGGYYRRLDGAGAARLLRLLPAIVSQAAATAAPAATLRRSLSVLQAIGGRTAYLALLHEQPLAARRLTDICAIGDFLPAQIAAHPLLLDELVDQRLFAEPPSRLQFEQELALKVPDGEDPDSEREVEDLREFQRAAVFRTALFDLTGRLPVMNVSDRLTDIAELILERVLAVAWRDLIATYGEPWCGEAEDRRRCGIAALGYGKLGGYELGYGSDLDIVLLHDSSGEQQCTSGPKVVENGVFYLRLGQRILHLLTMHGTAGRLYEVDTRLRPSGKGGPMVSNIEAFADYQRSEAWTWEHQALLHSRAVAGTPAIRARAEKIRIEALCRHVRRDGLAREVSQMRQRMRRERGSSDPTQFDVKRDAGGVADIEFLAQYWVLKDAHRFPALVVFPDTIRQLESVGSAALVDHAHIDTLVDAYREYRVVAHRLSLDGLPPVVPESQLAVTRAAVTALWQAYLGEPVEPHAAEKV